MQILFAPIDPEWSQDEQDGMKLLEFLAKLCLEIQPTQRPTAVQLQSQLFKFVAQRKWTTSLQFIPNIAVASVGDSIRTLAKTQATALC